MFQTLAADYAMDIAWKTELNINSMNAHLELTLTLLYICLKLKKIKRNTSISKN